MDSSQYTRTQIHSYTRATDFGTDLLGDCDLGSGLGHDSLERVAPFPDDTTNQLVVGQNLQGHHRQGFVEFPVERGGEGEGGGGGGEGGIKKLT